MTNISTVAFAICDVVIVLGWIWSLTRAWNAPHDPDLELAIEAARRESRGATPSERSIADLRRDAVDWKIKLETKASYPAFGSAVLSGVTLGFSGNAVGRSTSFADAWIVSSGMLLASLAVAFTSRLVTAKRIQHRLPRLLGR